MKRLLGAAAGLLVGASLLACAGCTGCPSPTSTASALGVPLTLNAATSQASFQLLVHAPEQACGCTWCGDPTLSLKLLGEVSWLGPSAASDLPVVRFVLAPRFVPAAQDTLEPPLPLDVVLTPQAPTAQPVLEATHLCPEDDACDVGYSLTVSRVAGEPAGAIAVLWSVGASFVSKPDGSLTVSVSP